MTQTEQHPFARHWPMANLLGRLHVIEVAGVEAADEYAAFLAAHDGRWYRISTEWAAKNKPKVGDYLVLFPGGQITIADGNFVASNLVIDGAPLRKPATAQW